MKKLVLMTLMLAVILSLVAFPAEAKRRPKQRRAAPAKITKRPVLRLDEFQAEFLGGDQQQKIFFRVVGNKEMSPDGIGRYAFPVPAGREYPPDLKMVGEGVVGTVEIEIKREGLLFTGQYPDWKAMARFTLSLVDTALREQGGRASLKGNPIDCTLPSAACEKVQTSEKIVAKGVGDGTQNR